jgi:hypothetical protein
MSGPQKITFGDIRESGVRGVLIYCSDYRCSHHIAVSGDQWGDDVRLSDLIWCAATLSRVRRTREAEPRLTVPPTLLARAAEMIECGQRLRVLARS